MSFERERLQNTLSANGSEADAAAFETLGRAHASYLPVAEEAAALGHASADSALLLREEIGRGGMATVWSAEQRVLGREVIVPIHQLLVDARGPQVVMKRSAGKTFAHSRKVLHRDIKPQNVLLLKREELRMRDGEMTRLAGVPAEVAQGAGGLS